MTTHRLVRKPAVTAAGTSGHGHRRAMTVDAAGRRLTWWRCDKADTPGGPCPDKPPPKPKPVVVPDDRRKEQVRAAARRYRDKHRAA